jgi:hypothetical protein
MDAPERARSTTRVVVDRDLNPFDRLSPIERRRLMVRVLCGLVAYDEPAEPAANVDLVLDLRTRPTVPVPVERVPADAPSA